MFRRKFEAKQNFLEQYGKTEAELLYQYINEIELGDVTNREGHVMKVYFNALFGKDFTRTEECPINAKTQLWLCTNTVMF